MNNIDDYSFTIINDQGIEVTCDVISLINDNDTNQLYVVYTDYLLTKNNKFRILVSELVEDNYNYILKDINDEEKIEEIKKTSLTLHSKAYKRLQEKYSNID
jgi:uncharacterized protein YrzB (UPF0473 family)